MDDATGMRVREARGDRGAVAPRLVPPERSARRDLVEAASVHELEHEHGLLLVLEHVVEADDVRVLEPRERGGLAVEPLAQVGVVGDPAVQHLQRDVAARAARPRARQTTPMPPRPSCSCSRYRWATIGTALSTVYPRAAAAHPWRER